MIQELEAFLKISDSAQAATKEEKETFLHLIKTKPEFAFDFINCWMILQNKPAFHEESFNEMVEHVNMLLSSKKVR